MADNNFEIPQSVEQVNKVEASAAQATENKREQAVRENIQHSEAANIDLSKINNATNNQVVRNSDIELKKVENILAENMDKVFLSLDAPTQMIFKNKGEEVAKKINVLLQSGQVKIKKVLDLILEWLRVIPKINKHFLQQEAKIKADQIMNLYHKNK